MTGVEDFNSPLLLQRYHMFCLDSRGLRDKQTDFVVCSDLKTQAKSLSWSAWFGYYKQDRHSLSKTVFHPSIADNEQFFRGTED